MIAFVRIDDRLVHGQVVQGWLPHLHVNEVWVVSEAMALDDVQKSLMRLALPESVELQVLPVQEAAERLKSPNGVPSDKKIFLLAPGPREILGLLKAGVPIPQVNVGGLHHAAGKVQVGKALFLDEEDRRALKAMVELGVTLEGRSVPSERAVNLALLL